MIPLSPVPREDTPPEDTNGAVDPVSEEVARKRPKVEGLEDTHEGTVTALVYSHDGARVASGSEDSSVIIWNVYTRRPQYKLPLHDAASSLAFSCDNKFLASACFHQELVIWELISGQELKRLLYDHPIHSVAYTPDGRYLVAGARDGNLCLWDAETYDIVAILEGNAAPVEFITFSQDGRLMATGGMENVCCIWDSATLSDNPTPKSVLAGHTGTICAVAFAPDNKRIATASEDGSSRIWMAETGETLVQLQFDEPTGPIWSIAFSPNGRRVAVGSNESTVRIHDAWTGEVKLLLDGHDRMVTAVAFSPDTNGRYLASASLDNTVCLWETHHGTCVTEYTEHQDHVTILAFGPNGSSLSSSSHDGSVCIRLLGHPEEPTSDDDDRGGVVGTRSCALDTGASQFQDAPIVDESRSEWKCSGFPSPQLLWPTTLRRSRWHATFRWSQFPSLFQGLQLALQLPGNRIAAGMNNLIAPTRKRGHRDSLTLMSQTTLRPWRISSCVRTRHHSGQVSRGDGFQSNFSTLRSG